MRRDASGAEQGQMLDVPGQTASPSGAVTGSTNANPRSDSIGRGSKRSLTGRQRDRSAGSKRSTQAGAMTGEKGARPGSSGRAQTAATSQSKPKKKGFLAMLCCSSPDREDTEMQDVGEAPKPVARTQQQRTAEVPQQTNVSAPGTSATESKEVIDEKPPVAAAQTPSEPIAPVAERANLPASEAALQHPPVQDSAALPPAVAAPVPTPEDTRQTAIPSASATGVDSKSLPVDSSIAPGSEVEGMTPTSILPARDEHDPPLDRTPEQEARDHDIEMQDASVPHLPLTTGEAAAVAGTGVALAAGAGAIAAAEAHEQRDSKDTQPITQPSAGTTLPPPPVGPPPGQRDAHEESEKDYDGAVQSQQDAAGGDQKWLLPPLRPELRGRKCLVLDLDETLVHSSFKVCPTHACLWSLPLITSRFCTKPTSRYQSRSKVSTTTYT